jgi:hypothetical protein
MILLNERMGPRAQREIAEGLDPFALPSVPFVEKDRLPNVRAVYFAIYDGRIVYIGLTQSVRQRWRSHSCLLLVKDPSLGRVAWIRVASSHVLVLHRLELALIHKHQPTLNVGGVKKENRILKTNGSVVHPMHHRKDFRPLI